VLEQAVRDLEGAESADFERERIYRKWTQLYSAMLPRYDSRAYSVSDAPGTPSETAVLIGGRLTSPGEAVRPGVFSVVGRMGGIPTPQIGPEPAARRLALARWIASPHHPLTARVIVNRVWHWHFGKGIVDTPSNFGKMGGRPSDPALLDWLAAVFSGPAAALGVDGEIERSRDREKSLPHSLTPSLYPGMGWSLKALHRLIMNSAAYQRSGIAPRRLEAEELRDSILAVSGELSLEGGGPGTFPEVNEDLARQPRHVMGTIAPAWEPSPTRAERNRRTIYTYQQRSLIDPLVEVFNGANPNESCERREASTVAPQVFNLFNSRFSHDMSLAFARRLEREENDAARRIDRAFQLAFGRLPSPAERARSLAHVEEMTGIHRVRTPEPPQPPGRLLRSAIVELTGEKVEIEEETTPSAYEPNLHPSQVGPETRGLAELCLVLFNSNEFAHVY
jgi:hypothetical protein